MLSRYVLDSSPVSDSTVNYLRVYFSGSEQAIPLYRGCKSSEGELLYSELLLDRY